MNDVGINLRMTENVSSVSPKVSSSLRNISDAGQEMKDALNLGDLESKYQKFAERVDKLYDTQKRLRRDQDNQDLKSNRSFFQGTQLLRTGIRGVATTEGGDVVGASSDVLNNLQGITEKLGTIGKITAVVGAAAYGINELSKVYEKHMQQVMEVNNILDRFGTTAQETSRNFGSTMNEISGSAARYGYSLNEGMNVYRNLIKEAGTTTSAEARDVMFFQRWGGFDVNALTQFRGRGARFGMGNQELLGNAYGTMRQTTMPKGLFSEFLTSTLDIFEQGISRGVVRGFDEINETQARIGRMGVQYQGQYGLNLLKAMDTRAAAGTGLETQGDLILFNSARDMLRQQGKATDYISVQKALEGGMTQDLLQNLYKQIKVRTGGVQPDMIEMFKEIIPTLTYTTAEALIKELTTGTEITAGYLVPGGMMRESDEIKLLEVQETIANAMRNLGKGALIPKAGILKGLGPIFEKIQNAMGWVQNQRIPTEYDKWKEWQNTSGFTTNVNAMTIKEGAMNTPTYLLISEMNQLIKNQQNYTEELVGKGKKAGLLMSGLSPEAIDYLSGEKFLETLISAGVETMSTGETTRGFSAYDMGIVLDRLTAAIDRFNKTVGEDKKINIHNIIGE